MDEIEFRKKLQQSILNNIREVFLVVQGYIFTDDNGKLRSDYKLKDESHTDVIRFFRQFNGTRNNATYHPQSFVDLYRFVKKNKQFVSVDISIPFIIAASDIEFIAGFLHEDGANFIFQQLWHEIVGEGDATFAQLYELEDKWRLTITEVTLRKTQERDRNGTFLDKYNQWMKIKNAEFNLMNGTSIEYVPIRTVW
jgi:hypothetical protein